MLHSTARWLGNSYVVRVCGWGVLLTWFGVSPSVARLPGAEPMPGEKIYRDQCARCHGDKGQGIENEYPQALTGDRSVGELTDLIHRTMPKDEADKCVGKEARQVAEYVYDAFYSPMAQVRNAPPRIELARLTNIQYRNAVADLIGSFRNTGAWDGERGLRGEYFKSRRFRNEDRVIERRDPVVQQNFGESSPDPLKIEPPEFAIRWQGCVMAPDTGEYEFILKTENGARLWINDPTRPLIDAWVRSGPDTEFRQSIRLLGGRVYGLRLEYFKAKEKTASIALEWKPPQRVVEVIPERYLAPHRWPESYVVTTAFPPDDRSVGYERGTSVSKAWDQATTNAAIDVGNYVVGRLGELAGVKDSDAIRTERVQEFCRRFVERAFRRPLTGEQRALYVERPFAQAPDVETAVKRVVLLTLKSPRFLFREVGADRPDDFDVAARLAFGLWDSLPDAKLLEAAAAGQLKTRDQIAGQAERMLPDLRTRAKLRGFLLQWMKVDQAPDVSKDPELFPEFDAAAASDLRTSLDLFIDEVAWSDSADYRQFVLTDSLYLNGRLARLYGVDLPADAGFQKVPMAAGERAGVLSHPYLMAGFAYTATSSPIHRGVFLARNVLGRALRPPPIAVAPLAPTLHADLTTRERVTLQTKPEACQVCHGMINPLGFTLEQYDAIGRFRTQEKGRPIDTAGTYITQEGKTVTFNGVRELADFLATSPESHRAFAEQMFQYLVKQPVQAYGPGKLDEIRTTFAAEQFHIRKLMVEILLASAQAPKETPTETPLSTPGATP